jgi:putative ABC transport system permease protein
VLDANHRGASDFTLIVPAELLAEQERTKRIFDIVMVALASISLLVGGIGIMNIMLASVLERTPRSALRRALGARRADIIRQFVVETTLISVTGGLAGLVLGAVMSRAIARLRRLVHDRDAGCRSCCRSRCPSPVGLVFGVYPATQSRAARSGRGAPLRVTGPPGRPCRRTCIRGRSPRANGTA